MQIGPKDLKLENIIEHSYYICMHFCQICLMNNFWTKYDFIGATINIDLPHPTPNLHNIIKSSILYVLLCQPKFCRFYISKELFSFIYLSK